MPPPQSTSVSPLSLRWSTQALVTHTPDTKSQAAVVQSALTLHFLVLAQVGQTPPPQSTSVSRPTIWRSKQWPPEPRHTCATASQAFEVQSALTLHFWPVTQVGQVPPPQSVSVSRPSTRWSVHWLDTQVSDSPSQAVEVQSASTAHTLPLGQAEQVPPPQSTSVSAPSFR